MEGHTHSIGENITDEPFLLGINYWPRTTAMYWWKSFDAAEVTEDFARIAQYGMRVVRFFLLWEDFQPDPGRIDEQRLRDLRTVLDIAQQQGLCTIPTLLVGNMSGVMWFPRWAFTDEREAGTARQIAGGNVVDRQLRSPFADPFMLRAEVELARTVAGVLAGHPALHSWDLANEIDAAYLPHDADAGWLWAWSVARALREGDADAVITYGAHDLSLTTEGLTIPALAPSLDYLSMHAYPIYNDVARGPLDPDFAPFLTALTGALGGKATIMQEFGLPTTPPGEPSRTIEDDFLGESKPQYLASEHETAEYYNAVLDRLWQRGAAGAIAWCYADYAPSLWDRPPLRNARRERTFGLFRVDGSPKPAAEVLRTFGRELLSGALARRLGARGAGAVPLTVDPVRYYRDPGASLAQAYQQYLQHIGEV